MHDQLTYPTICFDNDLPRRWATELLETYAAGVTLAELSRRVRSATGRDRDAGEALHRAVDDLLRSGVAEHVQIGHSRVVRLVAAEAVTR
ncbi:hypothetical protein GQ85_17715 [Rhodococcus rhodochrous]|nr:hypothetical protein GQ85_17715 [Rhodococcus rhodochrous]